MLSQFRAFSLIEMLIVISLVCLLGSIASAASFSGYTRTLAYIKRDELVRALRQARANAEYGGSGSSTQVQAQGTFISFPASTTMPAIGGTIPIDAHDAAPLSVTVFPDRSIHIP